MKRPILCTVLLCSTFNAAAVDVYKCKGANGETIYQNEPCPKGNQEIAKGEYQRQPDDPTQYYQAIADQRQRDAQAQIQARHDAIESARAQVQRDAISDAVSAANHDPRSPAGIAARNAEINGIRSGQSHIGQYATPIGAYRTPIGGAAAMPRSASTDGYPDIAREQDNAPKTPDIPPSLTDCQRDGGGSGQITCYDSNGNTSYGHSNPSGNAQVFDGQGNSHDLTKDATGKLRSSDGTCVKDQYGQCQ